MSLTTGPHILIGSLWRVNGSTYRVTSVTDTTDPMFPIVLEPVQLSAEHEREIREHCKRNRLSDAFCKQMLAMPIRVEVPWFDRRDVREVKQP